jgi:hypothetical protein
LLPIQKDNLADFVIDLRIFFHNPLFIRDLPTDKSLLQYFFLAGNWVVDYLGKYGNA